jgi:hypothetical protein
MIHCLQHILIWDAQINFIFKKVHHVISKKEYMGWYLSITCWIITPNPVQIPPREEIEYEPHAWRIQNSISICYFFIGFDKIFIFYLWIDNFYLLHIRLNSCYMMVDMLRLIFVIFMMMMDLLVIMYLPSLRHIVLHLTCYERHWV